MKQPLLHPVVLDSLVLATDAKEQVEEWQALLSPEGAAAWEHAVQCRQQVDDLAVLVRHRSWLAHIILAARRLGRRMRTAPSSVVEAILEPTFLGVMLDSSDEPSVTIALSWGRIEQRAVTPGTRVLLRPAPSGEPTSFFFARAGASAPLPSGEWDVEAGEAPVLLLACVGGAAAHTLEEALAMATAIAGLVLLEAA